MKLTAVAQVGPLGIIDISLHESSDRRSIKSKKTQSQQQNCLHVLDMFDMAHNVWSIPIRANEVTTWAVVG